MSELRLLTSEDHLEHRRLMSHAFGRGGVVEPPTEPQEPPKETLGIFEEGMLCSALTTCPFSIHWPGARESTLAMGGIAGVASYAEARGKGHVDRLLCESLVRMREAGQSVSALYPFSFSFYGRYGWGWVGEKYEATLPLRELPAGVRQARRLSDDEAKASLPGIYTGLATRYRGAFATGSRDFGSLVAADEKRLTYAYATEGGYLLWRYPAGEGAGTLREYVATTPEAERALLALLRDLGVQTERGSVTLPADTTLLCHALSWEMEFKLQPVFMGRVVDVAAALGQLTAALPDSRLTLALHDPHADWNAGTWSIVLEGGQVAATRTHETPQLTMDIQSFSQAFWGTPSLERLRRAGRVSVADEAAFTCLSGLLPAAPVMCWDHF